MTASHELLEMLVDPDINLCAFNATGGNTGNFYAYEVCDPCELDEQGYDIDGVMVSDFVYPAWFEGFRDPKSTQFDHKKLIKEPFGLLPGGYAQLLEGPSGLGWYQVDEPVDSAGQPRKLFPSTGSRRERRMRTNWLCSGMWTPFSKTPPPRGGAQSRGKARATQMGIWTPFLTDPSKVAKCTNARVQPRTPPAVRGRK